MSDQAEIMQALRDHDRRLVKVETELNGVHTEVATLRQQISGLVDDVNGLLREVGELKGGQKLILMFVGFGIPLIVGMELWNRLAG